MRPALDCATSSAASSPRHRHRHPNQLRNDTWLTKDGSVPLPDQTIDIPAEATAEEIEQAFANRMAIAYQSAAGPALGKDMGVASDWKREGLSTYASARVRRAEFWREIGQCSDLSPHVPVVFNRPVGTSTGEHRQRGAEHLARRAPQPNYCRRSETSETSRSGSQRATATSHVQWELHGTRRVNLGWR